VPDVRAESALVGVAFRLRLVRRVSVSSLHICGTCGSSLVHPLSIETRGEDRWWLELRCPECDGLAEGVFGRHTIEEFERELDRGHARLTDDLVELVQANMTEYTDRFASALAADAIYPMDF
jgi:hypothetical protein